MRIDTGCNRKPLNYVYVLFCVKYFKSYTKDQRKIFNSEATQVSNFSEKTNIIKTMRKASG